MGSPKKSPKKVSAQDQASSSSATRLGLLSALLAALVALASLWLSSPSPVSSSSRMSAVLESLLREETPRWPLRRPRVAVGYGACRDLFVRAEDIFGQERVPEEPRHFAQIDNREQLNQMFAYFFQHGAAAESV